MFMTNASIEPRQQLRGEATLSSERLSLESLRAESLRWRD
jgi:hypothetical protein